MANITLTMSNCGHTQTVLDTPDWTKYGYCERCLESIGEYLTPYDEPVEELTEEEWQASVELADKIADYGFDRGI